MKQPMPIWKHLEELRWILWKSLAVLTTTTAVGLALTDRVYAILQRPLRRVEDTVELIFAAPLDAFLIKLKLALLAGIVLALPIVLYLLFSFISPGLTDKERRKVYLGLGAGSLCFALGVTFGYLLLPHGLPFLVGFGTPGIRQLWPLLTYINFCFKLLLGFGIIFELPVVLSMLMNLGLIRVETLARHRVYAVILALIVAAALTPPDVISQLVLAAPLLLLYELTILFGRWQQRLRSKITYPRLT